MRGIGWGRIGRRHLSDGREKKGKSGFLSEELARCDATTASTAMALGVCKSD